MICYFWLLLFNSYCFRERKLAWSWFWKFFWLLSFYWNSGHAIANTDSFFLLSSKSQTSQGTAELTRASLSIGQEGAPLCSFQPEKEWPLNFHAGFCGGSDSEESACNAEDPDLIPGMGRSPGEGNGFPLQYSCLENFMDRGAWWATVHGSRRIRQDWVSFTFSLKDDESFYRCSNQPKGFIHSFILHSTNVYWRTTNPDIDFGTWYMSMTNWKDNLCFINIYINYPITFIMYTYWTLSNVSSTALEIIPWFVFPKVHLSGELHR